MNTQGQCRVLFAFYVRMSNLGVKDVSRVKMK